ncbi:MAG: ParB N-terminal domain-containing protein [Lachnospiraceae bacterium]|nr:ParB N-terminal domain-containing protein [Lachnospiraceae bacterium]
MEGLSGQGVINGMNDVSGWNDIKVNGIQEPIKYVEYDGQMYVVNGHHRLLAEKRLD